MDFSDDELSQVLKMQVKKEQDTEPLVEEAKPMDDSGNQALGGSSSEDKLSSAVPEDVSLNTPVSNPEEIANEPPTTETSNGTVEASTPSLAAEEEPSSTSDEIVVQAEEGAAPVSPLTEEPVSDSKVEPVTAESVNNSLTAKADQEGGDLEGSVTEENPPNPYDSDNEVVDDEPVAEEEADLMSQVPPPPPSQTNKVDADDPKVDLSAEEPRPAAADSEEVLMGQPSLNTET